MVQMSLKFGTKEQTRIGQFCDCEDHKTDYVHTVKSYLKTCTTLSYYFLQILPQYLLLEFSAGFSGELKICSFIFMNKQNAALKERHLF